MTRLLTLLLLALPLWSTPATAQLIPPPLAAPVVAVSNLPPVAPPLPGPQTESQALLQDGAEYARQYDVPIEEAIRRLRAQAESVAATDALAVRFRDRLAGIAIEHRPAYRIVVTLTGAAPVPPERIVAGGLVVPVVFRTGARATREQVVWAMTNHQAAIRAALPSPPSMGLDQRTGELVVTIGSAAPAERAAIRQRIAGLAGVPVRLRMIERDADFAPEGGSRVDGLNPDDSRRYLCTTGFNVTDGARFGVTTAAHCPDVLRYRAPDGGIVPLDFLGQWGWGYQDVQINLSVAPLPALFYVDAARTIDRPVTAARARDATRAGDFVCHRGERTGYSCAEVELTDFAPAGDLCGGACLPNWVTVAGPTCMGGDSGAPVFSGTAAFGILKGGSYRRDGSCAFYFYMSVDYLPAGWSLVGVAAAGRDDGAGWVG
ncbi:hypothetical protein PX554_21350 [Sphingomonas sp. H39-1-10]|uniref:hypothetical protein n=1 Tax=Sphingomonas pollutisoli TaxID=3030829 RepID=UPI0023B9FAD6|nr:hypothetical protein [Sphingomonas pollutisoli]MDF0490683.1 hypothetical protein [Sphingomonas pollutisoli]